MRMTNLNWSKLLKVQPEDITEQEKEELYQDIACFQDISSVPVEHVTILFRVAQEILKFKGEQVDSLVSEIESLAARQGEEEARRHQSLIDEIEILQDQLVKTQKLSSLTDSSTQEIHQELLSIQMKNEQLLLELQAKETDLFYEKQQVEKFANQVMILERERGELRSELAALQKESIEQQESRLQTESPSLKQQNLVETIRHKNKHITQLLNDIEALEKENNLLKLKLADVQKDLVEKSEQTSMLLEENTSLKHSVAEFQERISVLEEQNDALQNQLLEMAADKQKRDEQLDQLGVALDSRLAQWQQLLVEKDSELIELRQNLEQMSVQFSNNYMDVTRNHLSNMVQSLENREEQIEELQQQLAIANAKITEDKEVIKQLNSQLKSRTCEEEGYSEVEKLKNELADANNKLKILEERVADAEKDAEVKAEEMTEMVIQLREYETGVFGLAEAMEQIKELQKQKKVRDRHIEQLIQAGNQLQSDANVLEEENLALREQLGLEIDEVVRVDGVLAKYKADQVKLNDITNQLESTNNNLLTLSVQNRKYKKIISRLKSQIKTVGFEPEAVSFSSEDESKRTPTPVIIQGISEETKAMLIREAKVLETKLQDVIDENEALRRGMHEILDSVRSHDGTSSVQIESTCLERLLEALDSRHLSGWYHPAMRLQAQLTMVEGNNAALREQLRIARYNEHEATTKFSNALVQVDMLQAELKKLVSESLSSESNEAKTKEISPQICAKAIEFIEVLKSKSKEKLPKQRQESKEQKDSLELDEEFVKLDKKLKDTETKMADLQELYTSDKESWHNVRKGLQSDIDDLNEKVAALTAEVNEYVASWQTLKEDPDTIKRSLASTTLRIAELSSENEKLKRKCSIVQEQYLQSKNEKDCLQEEIYMNQSSTSRMLQELREEKMKLKESLDVLESIHSECYPVTELEELKKELNNLTIKYRELHFNKTNMEESGNKVINELKKKLDTLTQSSKETDVDKVTEEPVVALNKQLVDVQDDIQRHADKMLDLIKDQLKESEDHCKDLEKQLATLIQQNLSLQLVEAELRDQLVDSIPHSQLVIVKQHLAESQQLVIKLKAEQSRLEQNVEEAENKVKAIEHLRHCHDYQHDALQRQVLELSASSEDKLTIGRLTRELLRAQESELSSSKKLTELKSDFEKLQHECSEKDNRLKNMDAEYLLEKNEMRLKYRWLASTVNDLHQRYLGHLSIVTAESLQAMLSQARFEKNKAVEFALEPINNDKVIEMLKNRCNEAEGNTAKKIQEIKLKTQVQDLELQLRQVQGQLQRSDTLCGVLQEELLSQEKYWEKKQIIWEQKLLETLDIKVVKSLGEKSPDEIESSNVSNGSEQLSADVKSVHSSEEKPPMTSAKPYNFAETPIHIESESIKILNNQLNQVTLVMNEQTKKLNYCETELTELRNKMDSLKKQLEEKERKLKQTEKELLDVQKMLNNKDQNKTEEESTEVLALKATVASLQNIVNQKEETIGRYQTLLQECRDEHSITVANMQQELTVLQRDFDKKESLSKEEKSNDDKSSAMKVIFERYLAKVHQLEDDLIQSRNQAARLAVELASSQQQTDKWTHTAEERLKTIQEMKQRLDSARSKEDTTESNSDLMEKSSEIAELNKVISGLKAKLGSKESESRSRDRLRSELERANKRLEMIQNQNSELKAELQRLRKQLTVRQTSTPKSEVVSTAREEALQRKIKQLEEQVSEYQAAIQRGKEIHKSKCNEEFGKWEEKKRWQDANEKLKSQLREKTTQVAAMRANIDRLKDTIVRLEKEKISLEGKLKKTKVSTISQNLIDELERDRAKLLEELKAVRMRTSSGSSLVDSVAIQQKQIPSLDLSYKDGAGFTEEHSKLLENISVLQHKNLKLEAQNLELKMQLEKCQLSYMSPRNTQGYSSETESVGGSPKSQPIVGRNRRELEKAVIVLKRVVEKLQDENEKLRSARLNEVHDKGYVEKLQIELQRSQESYLDAMDKCSALEEEVQQYKEKHRLFQNDKLAEELSMTKAQLAQKCELLNKVKNLLKTAVIHEKALKEQIHDLQKLIPPERLRGTYHERRH